jgi:hypothetical protein
MMKVIWLTASGIVMLIGVAFCADPPSVVGDQTDGNAPSSEESRVNRDNRVSIAVARDRAQLMHDIYSATLDVMHERYFHGDRAMVPARAMEDIFSEIEQKSNTQARWISVNLKAMSVDHEPHSAFEKQAARELARGKTEVESIADGYYRRAGAIPLTRGCISCHGGFFKAPSKKPKFAGLVISIPIHNESARQR